MASVSRYVIKSSSGLYLFYDGQRHGWFERQSNASVWHSRQHAIDASGEVVAFLGAVNMRPVRLVRRALSQTSARKE